MILIKQASVYAPKYMGIKDILIAGGEIIQVADNIEMEARYLKETIYANGMKIIPGLIDSHCHIAGAGGEGGPSTRTPEIPIEDYFEAGITSVVGCLGTDGITRNVESVLMRAKTLNIEGMSAYIYTGSYQIPTPNITGSIEKDIALIEEIIGVGEIAISDHRSSVPTTNELAKVAAAARVGGMLGAKAGIMNIHLGDAKNPFQPIIDVVNSSELSYKQFLPTHINRNTYIFEDAKEYGKNGYIDITASSYPFFKEYEIKPSKAVSELLNSNVPLENICMSSDAGGSLPHFDENGKLIKLEIGSPKSLLNEFCDMCTTENIPIEKAISIVSTNVAKVLHLDKKGSISQSKDADLLILDDSFKVHTLIASGKIIVHNHEII
ncbi:MAG: beta-aspartyl-peptidase [Bacteroidetes bacterium 4572_77]|nr:MAG: beta-aspartyl-peptidase [Bacteroidetes bacterium 4572_77]